MANEEETTNLNIIPSGIDICPSTTCRICLSVSTEDLISPCYCRGTLQHVHRKCLQQWVTISMQNSCELCGFLYKAKVKRRYGCFEGVFVWLRQPEVRFFIEADILLLIATIMLSAVVCVVFIFRSKSEKLIEWPRESITIMLSFIVIVYAIVFYCFIRHTVRVWYNWWKSCVNITLIFDEESSLEN